MSHAIRQLQQRIGQAARIMPAGPQMSALLEQLERLGHAVRHSCRDDPQVRRGRLRNALIDRGGDAAFGQRALQFSRGPTGRRR
jgi:hypothetical protein